MNTFLFKGKDPGGDFRSESISAENAQEAKATLQETGWTDLRLVTDEICDTACAQVEAPKEFKEIPVSPDDQVRYVLGQAPGFWRQYFATMKQTARDSKVLLLSASALLAYGVYRRRWVPVAMGGSSLAVMILVFPAAYWFFSLPSRCYAQLNRAKVWGRWEEVLWCVERLRRIRRLTRIGPGEFELSRCRSQALAATGRLTQGLEEFGRFAGQPAIPDWTYESFLAGIYDCAKEYTRALECRRKAVALKTDSSALWIDLAYGLVRGLNHSSEAREAVARAETMELSELGRPYLLFLRGLICWRERKYREAKLLFEQAIPALQAFAHAPLTEGLVLLTRSYLCAAQGALGEIVEARKQFRQVEMFLEAGREKELLEACRRPIASP